MLLSASTSAISRSGVADNAAQSAIASLIKVAVETAVHVGYTAATRTAAVKQISRTTFGDVPKDEALKRIALISGALSVSNSAALEALYTTLAAKALREAPTPQDFAVGAAAGVLSSGILGASAYFYYHNDPSFRQTVDAVIQSLHTATRTFLGRSGAAHANQLDLENNVPSNPTS
jgi:hypothetical protein